MIRLVITSIQHRFACYRSEVTVSTETEWVWVTDRFITDLCSIKSVSVRKLMSTTHEHGSLGICLNKSLAYTSGAVSRSDEFKTHECVILASWVNFRKVHATGQQVKRSHRTVHSYFSIQWYELFPSNLDTWEYSWEKWRYQTPKNY